MDISNQLLKNLPPEEFRAIAPYLESVSLSPRQVLHLKGLPIEHLYFVEEGLVSVLAEVGGGEVVEVWLIGREGIVGLPVLLGGATSPFRRVVNVGGHALRVPAGRMQRSMEEHPALRRLLLRYAQAVAIQSGQTGACTNRHSLQQRLARWLLSAEYHLGRGELPLTHALLSRLLGTRRASVTVALGKLEAAGIVRQRRGEIVIKDRDGLEAVACNCHAIIRAAYDKIAADTDPAMPAEFDSGAVEP